MNKSHDGEHDNECEHGEVALRVGRRMNCTRAEMSELLNVQSVELCFCDLRRRGEWRPSETGWIDLVSVGVLKIKGERDRLKRMAISSRTKGEEERDGEMKREKGERDQERGEEEGGLVIFVDFKRRRRQ